MAVPVFHFTQQPVQPVPEKTEAPTFHFTSTGNAAVGQNTNAKDVGTESALAEKLAARNAAKERVRATEETTGRKDLYSRLLSGATEATEIANEADAPAADYTPYMFGSMLRQGADQLATGISSSADFLLGRPLKALGWENNPISATNEWLQEGKAQNDAYYDEKLADASKAERIVANLGASAVAAIPQAALAFFTAGTSLTGQTTAALNAASNAAQTTGLVSTIKNTLTAMAKDPQYWLSFFQVAGPSYDQAIADGTSKTKATANAMINGLLNALVEVGGGGIQELPTALRSGSKSAVKQWVDGMIDEGKEEAVQGIIERLVQNVTYGKGNALYSATDENAILNPRTAAGEFGMGALVGGILGGGQLAADRAINGPRYLPTGAEVAAEMRTDAPETIKTGVTAESGITGGSNAPVENSITKTDGKSSENRETLGQQKNKGDIIRMNNNGTEPINTSLAAGGGAGTQNPLFNNSIPEAAGNSNSKNAINGPRGLPVLAAGAVDVAGANITSGSPVAQKNIASDEAESTIVNTDPAQHTPAEQAVVDDYQKSVDDNLVSFVELSMLNKGANKGRYALKPVSDRATKDIKALTGVDTTGFKTVIEQRIVEHIMDRHGAAGRADRSMQDVNDLGRIQYVLDNYDEMSWMGKTSAYVTTKPNGLMGQANVVQYIKAVNGTYYVIEAVPDTKAKTTYIVSAYMSDSRNNKTGASQTADTMSPSETAKTENANSPATKSIPDSAEKSNGENAGNGNAAGGDLPPGVGAMSKRFPYQETVNQQHSTDTAFTGAERQITGLRHEDNTHAVVTDKEGMTKAQQRLAADIDGEKADLPTKQDWDKEDTTAAHLILRDLVDKARASGDYSKVVKWNKTLEAHKSAQALQANRQFADTPEKAVADAATFLDSGAAKKLPAKRKAQIIADVEAQSAALSGLPPGDTAGLIDIIKRNSEIRRTTGLFNKATSRTLDSAMKYYAANFAGAEGVLRDVAAAQIRNIATDYGKLSVLEAIKSYRIQRSL